MSNYQRNKTERSPGADPAVTALLRAAYAAPRQDSYWRSLEERVMSRIQETTPVAWWAVFSEWKQAGVVAATLALLIAGAAAVRERQHQHETRQLAAGAAYNTVFEESLGDMAIEFSVPGTEHVPEDAPERFMEPFYP